MDNIRQYILTVVAAAVICTIVLALTAKSGPPGAIMKVLTGIFLAVTVLTPFRDFSVYDWRESLSEWGTEAAVYVQEGEEAAKTERQLFIKSQTEAYILDRAEVLGLDLDIEVALVEDDPFAPETVYIDGEASPYNKKKLQQIISQELGITEDNQIWT